MLLQESEATGTVIQTELSQAEVMEIRELHASQQYSFAQLARMFRVDEKEIKRVLKKKRAKK